MESVPAYAGGLGDHVRQCWLIVFALSSGRSFFEHRRLIFLGRISYSLYLIHVPIMLALANSLFGKIPIVAFYFIILWAVLAGAICFWYVVERHGVTRWRFIVAIAATACASFVNLPRI